MTVFCRGFRLAGDCRLSRSLALVMSFWVTLVTLGFGLWPLNFNSENQVYWLLGQHGVQFHKQGSSLKLSNPGVIYGALPMDIQSVTGTYQPATVELYVEPHHEAYNNVAHILAFGDGTRIEPFVIGQWKTDLEIICQDHDGRAGKAYKQITLKDALHKDVQTMITITSDQDRTCVYLNGQLAKTIVTEALIGLGQFKGHLMLGNASDCGNQWVGKLYGLALYQGMLSPEQVHSNYESWTGSDATQPALTGKPIVVYTFDEQHGSEVFNQVDDQNHLVIPKAYSPLKRNMLMFFGDDLRLDHAFLKDVIINVSGFMPIAFLMAVCFNGTGQKNMIPLTLAIVLIGTLMSLGIEVSQAYLPTRTSSLLDVLCDSFGAFLGVLSYRLFFRKAAVLGLAFIGH